MNIKNVSKLQRAKDLILFPLRVILKQEWLKHFGLSTLAEERAQIVLPFLRGRVLDIGCGENLLVKAWGNGVGVDVYPWPGVDMVVDTTKLPFENGEFDTVTFIASLNHIPEREKVLKEAFRVLKKGGQVIVTMIGPKIGLLCHGLIWGWDKDQHQRGMEKGEKWGMAKNEVEALLKETGFSNLEVYRLGFLWLNTLYKGRKS